MKVGFIGLGNVGGKLAGSILRNGLDLTVRDLDKNVAQRFLDQGAKWADSPKQLAENCDLVITCLPSPAACSAVMESDDGVLAGLSEGKIWAEMSTTDDSEVQRIAALVTSKGASAIECPVSGRLPSRSNGQYFHFRRLRSGCIRANVTGADDAGATGTAHRTDWFRLGTQSDDQLSGDRQSAYCL